MEFRTRRWTRDLGGDGRSDPGVGSEMERDDREREVGSLHGLEKSRICFVVIVVVFVLEETGT